MDDRALIRKTVQRLTWRLRTVRALTAGSCLLAPGLGAAAAACLAKAYVPNWPWVAGGLVLISVLAGVAYGLLLPAAPDHVARLADARLGLKERLTAALEHGQLPSPSPLALAQLAEAAARAKDLRTQDAFPLRLMPEARQAAPFAVLLVAFALLPALSVRFPMDNPPEARQAGEPEEKREERLEQQLAKTDLPKPVVPEVEHQDSPIGPRPPHIESGDEKAVYRDTKMSQQRPDFGSFVKQGDERLKMLARPENLPDLQRDFTQNPYQVMINRMRNQMKSGNMQGLTWEQIEKLLSDLGEAQQRGGEGANDDLLQELQKEGQRSPDRMLSALSRALKKRQGQDGAGQGTGKGKDLRQAPSRQSGEGKGQGDEGGGQDGKDENGQAGGSQPGTERSLQTTQNPTSRIGGDKQDTTLEGEARQGQSEAYDTNLSGAGEKVPSQLPYLSVFSRYKKMMEEALAKEPIPFSYREQVKEYFRTLERR